MSAPTIAIVFDGQPGGPYYAETLGAVEHAIAASGRDLAVDVVPTSRVDDAFLSDLPSGVFIGPGTPYDAPDAAEEAIRSARERGVPLVAT